MLKANKIAKAQRINCLRFNYSLYSEREEEKKYDISLYCLRFNYSKKKKKNHFSKYFICRITNDFKSFLPPYQQTPTQNAFHTAER